MKKKIVSLGMVIMMIGALLCGCSDSEEEITVEDNQTLIYAYVTAIDGNEITYMEVDESQLNLDGEDSSTEDIGNEEMSTEGKMGGGMQGGPGNGEAPDGSTEMPEMDETNRPEMNSDEMPEMDSTEMGNMPQGEAPSGEKPSGEAPTGEAPNGESMDSTEMPAIPNGENSDKAEMGGGNTVTTQIPVGVTVHTASGTTTTFSRIAEGDLLKILLETDEDGNEVIVEIWMVE